MDTTKIWVNILDILWPVGSLYYCLAGDESSPAVVLGGTWVQKTGSNFVVGNQIYTCYTRIA